MRCLTIEECRLWRKEHSGSRAWRRQLTCVTPQPPGLPWFTAELAKHLAPFRQALLIIDQVVFDVPEELEALRRAAGETRTVRQVPGLLFEGDGDEFRQGLHAVFRGWFDFRVLFWPTRHALRADHDQWTTVFSAAPGRFAAFRDTLVQGGIQLVPDAGVEPP